MTNIAIRLGIIGVITLCTLAPLGAQESDPIAVDSLDPRDRVSEPEERVWLDLAAGRELAFFRQDDSGATRGGVLLIPDNGRHPLTRGSINTLRHALSRHHWHTLALDSHQHDAATMQQLIAAGVAFLNQSGVARVVLLGRGAGAVHAVRFVAAQPAGRISGLVLLDADNRIPGLEEDSMTALQSLSLPVMDAYRSDDYRRLQQAQRRRTLAGDNAQYFPTRVPNVALHRPDEPNRVSQRIRGWIDKYIAGITADTF